MPRSPNRRSAKRWKKGGEICDSASGQRHSGAGHRGVTDAARRKTEPQARGLVQGLSLSGRQLEDSTTSSGEDGVPCWGVVPASGIHRDQPGDTESGSRALLQQARYSGAVDQGGQAGNIDDPAFFSSFLLEPSAAGAEPVGLQPGKPVAAAGVAEANRELVTDESAAAAGEDGRTASETCALLLVAAGGRTSDAAAIQGHAGPDRSTTGDDGGRERQGGRVCIRNLSYQRLGKEECCKNKAQDETIPAVPLRMARPLGVLR